MTVEPFVALRGWRNPHLQTVRSRLRPARVTVPDPEMKLVEVSDADRLAVFCNDGEPGRPTVVLVHGLGGSAESEYMRVAARGLLDAGFGVARVDLRGAGTSGEYSGGMYHGGRTEDLAAVVASFDGPVALMGFSLGGNMVVKFLGERSQAVVAAVAVSAPLDLGASSEHLHQMAGGMYERFIMRKLRREALRAGARYTPEERQGILAARRLREFDDAVTGPRHGWRDAQEYYDVNSSLDYLPAVDVPLLLLHSKDDPMVPFEPYESVDWGGLPTTTLVLTEHGGHLGFHGRGAMRYYVDLAVRFLAGTSQS